MLTDGSRVRRSGNIRFLGVARTTTQEILASLTVNKDESTEQYLKAVREVLNAPNFANKVSAGARYRLNGAAQSFNFSLDQENRMYIAITALEYPESVCFRMINDFIPKFQSQGAKGGDVKRLLTELVAEYDDPTKKDTLSKVIGQVDDVTGTMKKNINGMLENIAVGESIQDQSEQLVGQANAFKSHSTSLRRQEQCKQYQTYAVGIGCCLLIIVILVIAIVGGGGGGGTTNPVTFAPTTSLPVTLQPTVATTAPTPAPIG